MCQYRHSRHDLLEILRVMRASWKGLDLEVQVCAAAVSCLIATSSILPIRPHHSWSHGLDCRALAQGSAKILHLACLTCSMLSASD